MQTSLIQNFHNQIRGAVLYQGGDAYDDVRTIHNSVIDKPSAVIVRCKGTADVIDSINIAREHNLFVTLYGGNHGLAGNAVCEGELMLDLSQMNSIRVDPQTRIAWVEGGATLDDVDRETKAFGLVAPAGVISTTGVAGLTIDGGIDWASGMSGHTIDNLLSVDIVTADGQFHRASESEDNDLFWALREGCKSFGIITSLKFRLYPLGPVQPATWRGYLNMFRCREDSETLEQNTHKSNIDRLRKIKQKYDPTNLFRINANIVPVD